jgi:DNA primase
MHQAGIENVVASSGTSLTIEQIRLIRRYTSNITILYDGDPAGIKASFRGIDLILEEGMNVRVLLFPDNDDPDSYSKKVTTEEFKSFIRENTKDFIAFKTELLSVDTKNDPIKKSALIHDIVASISLIPDAITRSVYVKDCSRILNIEEQTLLNELNKQRKKNYEKKKDDTHKARPVEEQSSNFVPDLAAPQGQQPVVEQKTRTEYQEREIIRLLLNYGTHPVPMTGADEQGNAMEIEGTVADFIVVETEHEQFPFETEVYRKIMEDYVKHHHEGVALDHNYFVNHADKTVCEVTVDFVTTPYQLSNWERHFIYVHQEIEALHRAALSAINSLQLRRLEVMILDVQKELRESENYEDQLILIQKQKSLVEAKKEFSKKLGRVVLK